MTDLRSEDKLPWFETVVLGLLGRVVSPKRAFDPAGDWEHTYSIWLLPAKKDREPSRAGSLIVRRVVRDGLVDLAVEQASVFRGPGAQEMLNAAIQCKQDVLASPVTWRVESRILDVDGHPVKNTDCIDEGKSESPAPLTCNWSLFDAVQRLPFGCEALRFDLLEDLALVKPGHVLRYGGLHEARALHRFEQTGNGILPAEYWLDESHRLLMVVGGVRAFVLEGESQ